MFQAKIVCDSIGPNDIRLTSVEATYPRFIHAEIMTHRDRARNAASSRAIPWKKNRKRMAHEGEAEFAANMTEDTIERFDEKCMYRMIMTKPVVPIRWGVEQPKMQMGTQLSEEDSKKATKIWLEARDAAVRYADQLAALNVHKSLCNRLTEPFMWITVLITATEWKNFFRLRCHPAAEIHFQTIAGMIREAIDASQPKALALGAWHLPYIKNDDCLPTPDLLKVSTGRCARLSYLTHEGKRDYAADIALHDRLLRPPGEADEDIMHASPFEHIAEATNDRNLRSGPFRGWRQYRKQFPNENVEG